MTVAVLVAAGRGERLGAGGPKALVPLGGRPMLAWSLATLVGLDELRRVVLVLPDGVALPDDPARWGLPVRDWASVGANGSADVVAVPGGRERSHSVRAGLDATDAAGEEPVVVHDGARPLLEADLVRRCVAVVEGGADAAIAAAPVTDTVKEHDATVAPGAVAAPRVLRTLDRSRLWAVQTPQVFRADALARALAAHDDVLGGATDDASLVEAAGGDVRLVTAPRWNLKITLPEDLAVAELLLAGRERGAPAGAAR